MSEKNPCNKRGFFASRKESNTRKCREYQNKQMINMHNMNGHNMNNNNNINRHNMNGHNMNNNMNRHNMNNNNMNRHNIGNHQNVQQSHKKNPIKPHFNTQTNTHPTTRHLNTARQQMF